jgi:DNA-directed RNA polymerase subunit RPC12/RpoP
VKKIVKGRTTCPKCKHEFVLDVEEDKETYKVTCPNCNNDFTIKTSSCNPNEKGECSWEEHGEPRKTILSSIKPRTNKPMIAAVLLIIVFCMGLTTAVFSETFVETSLDIASEMGIKGTVELLVTDQMNQSIENVNITIDGRTGNITVEGLFHLENVTLGKQTAEIYAEGYNKLSYEILVLPIITTYHEIKMEKGAEEKIIPFDALGCSLIFAILSVFALFGAVSCLKRKHFDVAIAGSIISIFSFGFFMIGAIISIIAVIIIMKCKEEFDDGKKGKTF